MNLEDLEGCIGKLKQALSTVDNKSPVKISEQAWEKVIAGYSSLYPRDNVFVVDGHTLVTSTSEELSKYISCQEIPVWFSALGYFKALKGYKEALDQIAQKMGFGKRDDTEAREVFALLPDTDWRVKLKSEHVQLMDQVIDSIFTAGDANKIQRFISDGEWSGIHKNGKTGRHLERDFDWAESAIMKVVGVTQTAAAGRFNLLKVLDNIEFNHSDLTYGSTLPQLVTKTSEERLKSGQNEIFYGAPGTGKSYVINQKCAANSANVVRTVFHSDTQNSDFIGALKPATNVDGGVSYRFSAGPFALALLRAYQNPSEMHYLVIEELNRAPAASVFGELFLLLDRDESGASQYDADFPSEEFQNWWNESTGTTGEKLKLPSNLTIFASMNSADQGVFPLDTAFRRRWMQTYVPIDYGNASEGSVEISIDGPDPVKVQWSKFVEKLNYYLTNQLGASIPEDRLVGQRFLSPADLEDGKLPGKLLIYLWDDVLRHHGREILFSKSIKTYGDLALKANSGDLIFSTKFIEMMSE